MEARRLYSLLRRMQAIYLDRIPAGPYNASTASAASPQKQLPNAHNKQYQRKSSLLLLIFAGAGIGILQMSSIWLLVWISCVHVDGAKECNSGPMYGAKVYQTEPECNAQVTALMPRENEIFRLRSLRENNPPSHAYECRKISV